MVRGKKEKPTIWGDKKKSIQILCDKIHPNLVWTKVVLIWLYSEYVSSVVRDQLQIRRLQWPLVHARVWCTFELQISKHVSFVYCWWKEASKNNIGEARERSRRRDMETKGSIKNLLSNCFRHQMYHWSQWMRNGPDSSSIDRGKKIDHLIISQPGLSRTFLVCLPVLWVCVVCVCLLSLPVFLPVLRTLYVVSSVLYSEPFLCFLYSFSTNLIDTYVTVSIDVRTTLPIRHPPFPSASSILKFLRMCI